MALGDLGRRFAVAGVTIPLALLVIYLGGWILGTLLALLAAGSASELYALAARGGVKAFPVIGIPLAAILVLLVTAEPDFPTAARAGWIVAVVGLLASLAAAVWWRGPEGRPLEAVSVTVAGVLLGGGTLSFVTLLRHLPELGGADPGGGIPSGALLVVFPLLASWFGDTCAYLAGSRWGRRKLLPSVSPGKTVVGALAGLVGSATVAAVYGHFVLERLSVYGLTALGAAGVGLVIGLVSQVGDLGESVLKRQAGVKDSGRLLPGHGGLLDRFDGVYFAIPVTYALLVLDGIWT